jgi:hypothetical protein
MIPEDEVENFNIFFSATLVACMNSGTSKTVKKRSTRGRKNEANPVEAAGTEDEDESAELSDFVQVSLHVIVHL